MIQRAALTLALLWTPAVAAQMYIVPQGDCGTVTLQATRAGAFPELGEGIPAARVTRAFVNLPRKRLTVTPAEGSRALTFSADVPENAVVMASLSVAPEVRGSETRTEHAKALLFCGPTPVVDWQVSVGAGLEIIPQGWNGPRPLMKMCEPMLFMVIDGKKIVAHPPMQLYSAGGEKLADGVPVGAGLMQFDYPAPGLYLVVATHRRPDPENADLWLVDTATLTFAVK